MAHVATVDLRAVSSPETVLSQDRLQGVDVVSTMTRRAGAVLGVNGDFFLGSGRPVHLYANDGRLLQTPLERGRAFGIDRTGTRVSMGAPEVRNALTLAPSDTATATVDVSRVNAGGPTADGLAEFTAAGALLETPPDEECYKTLTPAAQPLRRCRRLDQHPVAAGAPAAAVPGRRAR